MRVVDEETRNQVGVCVRAAVLQSFLTGSYIAMYAYNTCSRIVWEVAQGLNEGTATPF